LYPEPQAEQWFALITVLTVPTTAALLQATRLRFDANVA
jgi:hypothetical protein